MVSDELLKITRCLVTGTPLARADAELCQRVNAAIDAGKLRNRLGRTIDARIDAAFVNADGSLMYPIYNEVPQLLRDEAIELHQLEQE